MTRFNSPRQALDKHNRRHISHHLSAIIFFSDTRSIVFPYVSCQSEDRVFSLVRYKTRVLDAEIPNIGLINVFSMCHNLQKMFHGACDFFTVIYRSREGEKRIIIKFSLSPDV